MSHRCKISVTAKGIRIKFSIGQQVDKWRKAKTKENKEARVCMSACLSMKHVGICYSPT